MAGTLVEVELKTLKNTGLCQGQGPTPCFCRLANKGGARDTKRILANVKADTLFDILANTPAEVETEKPIDRLVKVKAKALL